MSNRRQLLSTASLLVGALLVAVGCGGGGGGGEGGGGGGLGGTFKLAELSGVIDLGAPRFGTFTGTSVAQSDGTLQTTSTLNDQGVLTSGILTSHSIALGADRSFSLLIGTTPTARGWFDPSGDVALTGSVNAGNPPFFDSLVRTWPSTATNASLTGNYHLAGMGSDGSVTALVGRATSDGAGNLELPAGTIVNNEGTISVDAASSVAYSVAADGTTTIGNVGNPLFSGGLAPGGGFLVFSGSTTPGEDPRLYVFLQAATSASIATLSETYRVVGLGYDFGTPRVRSMTGTMTVGAPGNATVQWTTNTAGVITNDAPFAVTFSVALDGVVALTTPSEQLQGAVSQDGNRGFLAGGTDAGSDPILLLFVRQ